MRQRAVAVGCWAAPLPAAALIAHLWVLAAVLAVWAAVAVGLANGDA